MYTLKVKSKWGSESTADNDDDDGQQHKQDLKLHLHANVNEGKAEEEEREEDEDEEEYIVTEIDERREVRMSQLQLAQKSEKAVQTNFRPNHVGVIFYGARLAPVGGGRVPLAIVTDGFMPTPVLLSKEEFDQRHLQSELPERYKNMAHIPIGNLHLPLNHEQEQLAATVLSINKKQRYTVPQDPWVSPSITAREFWIWFESQKFFFGETQMHSSSSIPFLGGGYAMMSFLPELPPSSSSSSSSSSLQALSLPRDMDDLEHNTLLATHEQTLRDKGHMYQRLKAGMFVRGTASVEKNEGKTSEPLTKVANIHGLKRVFSQMASVGLLYETDARGQWMKLESSLMCADKDSEICQEIRHLVEVVSAQDSAVNQKLANLRKCALKDDLEMTKAVAVRNEREKTVLGKYQRKLKKIAAKHKGGSLSV